MLFFGSVVPSVFYCLTAKLNIFMKVDAYLTPTRYLLKLSNIRQKVQRVQPVKKLYVVFFTGVGV